MKSIITLGSSRLSMFGTIATLVVAGSWSAGCQGSGENVEQVAAAVVQTPPDPPGTPGAGCGRFVERLANGDVRFAATFTTPQAYVEVFVRQNGVQTIAQNLPGVANLNGTYTYGIVKPASQFRAGDVLRSRFYAYRAGRPGVFTPGPSDTVWAPDFVYGQTTCDSGPPSACNAYVSTQLDGTFRFAVTLPATQAYVEVFVRQNGVQTIAQNILSSRVANADGTSTYSLVKPASQFAAGDRLLTRFYSYRSGQPGVFTPGPNDQVWAPELVVGQEDPCATTCDAAGTCRTAQFLPTGVAPMQAAVMARRRLSLGDGAKITGAPGTLPPVVVNSGTDRTELGARAAAGSLWSKAPVVLGTAARANGYLVSTKSITTGTDATVIGEQRANATVSQDLFEWTIHFVKGTTDVTAASQTMSDLAPGAYRKVTVKSGAVLRLTGGRYDLDALVVETGGVVKSIIAGTRVNVRRGLKLDGQVRSGDASTVGLLLNYYGTAAFDVRDIFEGALFAAGPVTLRGADNAAFRGSISASDVFLAPNARLIYTTLSAPPPPPAPDEGNDGALGIVGGDPRPESSRAEPVEVFTDNPYLWGGFALEAEITATKAGTYSHEYKWNGLEDAHFSSLSYPEYPEDGPPRRNLFDGLPWDGSELIMSAGFPTTARWHYRGTQLIHGNVYSYEASMTPQGGGRLQNKMWTRLSNDTLVVPVVVLAYEMVAQSAEEAEKRRQEVVANIDFLRPTSEGRLTQIEDSQPDPTKLVSGPQDPPDDLWLTCGIQFRVVGSFVLPRPEHDALERCASQSHSFAKDVESIHAAIAAVRPDLANKWFSEGGLDPMLVEIGPLRCSNYVGNTIPNDNTIEISTKDWSSGNGTVLAHELGHAMNLFHVGSNGSGNLMAAGAGSTDRSLNKGQCDTARSKAKSFRNHLHDYDVANGETTDNLRPIEPGSWLSVPTTTLPPPICCSIDGEPTFVSRIFCVYLGGTVTNAEACKVCCAVNDPAGHNDTGDFSITRVDPDMCSEDRLLEAGQCDSVCCARGTTGSRTIRYACLASNPAKGITPGRIVEGSEEAELCPKKPPA